MHSPLKLAPTAYALDIVTSVMSAPSNFASGIKAADNVLPLRFVLSFRKSQKRKSRSLSATPFAWPIVFPTNAFSHRFGSVERGGSFYIRHTSIISFQIIRQKPRLMELFILSLPLKMQPNWELRTTC